MKRRKLLIPLLVTSMVLMAGCSASTESASETTPQTDATQVTTTAVTTDSTVDVDTTFTDRDMDPSYDESTAVNVSLNGSSITVDGSGATADGSTLTISAEGIYVLTGTLTDGQIIVDAADTDKIQIVLNGVEITSSTFAPIYVKNANKVFITLADNTQNTLTDGSAYTQLDDNNVDAVIFSKTDLTLNGTGSLTINSNYKNAIVGKDDLVITGGNYTINTVNNAISGKNSVRIADGTFTITAPNGKGITSQNEDDSTKGYIYMAGGTINITSCNEGLEGVAIVIADGNINLVSSDDGFNAASPSSDSSSPVGGMGTDANAYILISGGTININASGDGLDSNGSLYITGGQVYVSGPTNSGNGGLDYNGTADISGGTVVIVGSSGMAQSFSDSSTQYSLLYNFDTSSTGLIELTDASGNVIVSFTPDKTYQSVLISTPELADGQTYNLTAGSQTAEITLSGMVTSNGQSGGMGGGMGSGGKGGDHSGQIPTDGTTQATPSDNTSTPSETESYQLDV